jgi:phage-related protein
MPKLASRCKIELMKPLEWIATAKKDLKAMPDEVQDNVGYALLLAQLGEKHDDTKLLKGFKGAGVLEVVDNFDGDTYRAVYTVRFESAVYVLHVFQKRMHTPLAGPCPTR